MSFTSEIKQELNKSISLSNKESIKYELIGYLITNNISFLNINEIRFATESDYNINRYSKILANLDINHNIEVSGKTFVVKCKIKGLKELLTELIDISDNNIYMKNVINNKNIISEEMYKSIIRGAFLGSGTINNPQKKYHLEINFSNNMNMEIIVKILNTLGLNVKKMETKNIYSIYIKGGEEISNILALIGANKAVMNFESIRIERQMRGKVNRIVNCETANLNKTLNASVEQITAIKKLKQTGQFHKLEDNLKELAELRIKNPNLSLVELGEKLSIPVGKSGVNYRLKKIIEIANG